MILGGDHVFPQKLSRRLSRHSWNGNADRQFRPFHRFHTFLAFALKSLSWARSLNKFGGIGGAVGTVGTGGTEAEAGTGGITGAGAGAGGTTVAGVGITQLMGTMGTISPCATAGWGRGGLALRVVIRPNSLTNYNLATETIQALSVPNALALRP
jgi:hypothetical protein